LYVPPESIWRRPVASLSRPHCDSSEPIRHTRCGMAPGGSPVRPCLARTNTLVCRVDAGNPTAREAFHDDRTPTLVMSAIGWQTLRFTCHDVVTDRAWVLESSGQLWVKKVHYGHFDPKLAVHLAAEYEHEGGPLPSTGAGGEGAAELPFYPATAVCRRPTGVSRPRRELARVLWGRLAVGLRRHNPGPLATPVQAALPPRRRRRELLRHAGGERFVGAYALRVVVRSMRILRTRAQRHRAATRSRRKSSAPGAARRPPPRHGPHRRGRAEGVTAFVGRHATPGSGLPSRVGRMA